MLSAIASRKDSAQSSKEKIKAVRDHRPFTTSPLASSSNPDIVTNDERAKSPEITRVLSPMRPRRTPKLVNAPDIRWRMAPHLQHMPSLDSTLSANTLASEASTIHQAPVAPHEVALPISSASSIVTIIPEADSQEVPHSPSPPPQSDTRLDLSPQVDTRFNEVREHVIPTLGARQPHFLSPVIEDTSAPSIRSSIVDLNIQDVGTAECRPLSDVRRHNVNVLGASRGSLASQQSRQSRAHKRANIDTEEQYDESVRTVKESHVHGVSGANGNKSKEGTRGAIGKLRERVNGAAGRIAEYFAKKYVTRVLAKLL